ncbi:hypothetical protein Tco_0047268 [Tanacetum coccineum]
MGLSTAGVPLTVGEFPLLFIASVASGEHHGHTDHVLETNAFPNRFPAIGIGRQNASSYTRRGSTIGGDTLCQQARVSGPPPDNKPLGSCTHSCQSKGNVGNTKSVGHFQVVTGLSS